MLGMKINSQIVWKLHAHMFPERCIQMDDFSISSQMCVYHVFFCSMKAQYFLLVWLVFSQHLHFYAIPQICQKRLMYMVTGLMPVNRQIDISSITTILCCTNCLLTGLQPTPEIYSDYCFYVNISCKVFIQHC